MSDVKRPYDSTSRKLRALRNREAILDAALNRFLSDGYAATTIATVARTAGVSVETIYKSFDSKAGLVTAIWQRGLAGHGPVPAPIRSDRMQQREANPRTIIANWAKLTTEVMPLVAPVLLLIRSAATLDPEMAALLVDSDRQRLQRMRHNAKSLATHLRPGITQASAAEVLWLYSAADLYDLLVVRRGWSMRRYRRFLADAMTAALLAPTAPAASGMLIV